LIENLVRASETGKLGVQGVVAEVERLASASALLGAIITEPFDNLFSTLVEDGKLAFKDFAKSLGQTIKKVIADLLSAIAVAAVLAALLSATGLSSFTGAFSSFLGGGGSGIGGILKGLLPGLAQGGIVPGGFPNDSYPAMLSSNEAVIPLDRLPSMMREMGGGGTVQVEGIIRGEDIYLSNRRAGINLGR
jgi:hypothetical protein